MSELKGCILFWERTLSQQQYLLEPATKALILMTIQFLKDLEELEERA